MLEGIVVRDGALVYDPDAMISPGDLLHEAGHLAILDPADRATAAENLGSDGGAEMGAIAWSWAAARAIGLAPGVLFHADGYRGGAGSLAENFTNGRYLGVPMLQWKGLTAEGERAAELGVAPYPAMIRWLVA